MLRVKIPQGLLTGAQLEALADVADLYSRGFGHITTRQNVQFHFMRLHDVEPAMRRLGEAGLTTREACGNSVRNITACPFAGVAGDELFDVTPYAEALTRYLLRHPLSSKLPRKFKIGFEGCPEDHTKTGINDLGFRATASEDGARGFRVTVAGRHRHPLPHRLPAARLHPDRRDLRRRRRGAARVRRVRRLSAQAAQPPEVPDQEHGLGALACRVPASSRGRARGAATGAPVRPGPCGPRDAARLGGTLRAGSDFDRGARRVGANPRHRHPAVAAAGDQRHRGALAAQQCPQRRSSRATRSRS